MLKYWSKFGQLHRWEEELEQKNMENTEWTSDKVKKKLSTSCTNKSQYPFGARNY